MREITSHVVEGDTAPQLQILATDDPGSGGANHEYVAAHGGKMMGAVSFQNGTLRDAGVNGVTIEALLAICADRLTSFQAGPFAAQENATALSSINNALRALQQRTLKRIARGVEGTQTA